MDSNDSNSPIKRICIVNIVVYVRANGDLFNFYYYRVRNM